MGDKVGGFKTELFPRARKDRDLALSGEVVFLIWLRFGSRVFSWESWVSWVSWFSDFSLFTGPEHWH